MYCYTYDKQTGGILLNENHLQFSKEPRPVYSREMDILGFDKRWKYENQDDAPYMWAESNAYWYRGDLVAKTHGGSLYDLPTVEYTTDEDGNAILPEGERLEPVDIPAMVEKNAVLISVLEQSTIQKIYDVYRRYRKRLDCFHVAFSGGKDSIVLLDLVKKALPRGSFVVVFGDTGMEFPDTYDVVDKVEAQCKEEGINFYRAASHLKPEESWKMFGPPSRDLRWCCSVHKSAPQTLKLREILNKDNYVGMDFVGIRAQESSARSEYEYENYGKKQKGQYSHNPILEWHSGEVWLYIYKDSLVINEAYKKGNSRAGCLFCPMTQGKNLFFRFNTYKEDIDTFIQIIRDKVSDSNIESYITNGGWTARKNGRDLANNPEKYTETSKDGYLYISITNPTSNWQEWIKTLGDLPVKFEVIDNKNGYIIKIKENRDKIALIKKVKYIFRKAAYCIGCGVCLSNCKQHCISFNGGLNIENCIHCGECLNLEDGCILYESLKHPKRGIILQSFNSFADHAPKYDWLCSFFENPIDFLKENSLGPVQQTKFKRFLSDACLIKKSKSTSFTDLILRIGWESDVAWGLILTELANNNPQIRWYIQNMDVGDVYQRDQLETKITDCSVSVKDANSIIKSFVRLCNIPLGTMLHFGETTEKGNHINTLCRTKCVVTDARVILYALYKFAEACEGYYQFSLSRLMDFNVESVGVSPAQIFGLTRDDMEAFLNGLSAAYPEFINATFTHDLDAITLREGKTSEDVLRLFE